MSDGQTIIKYGDVTLYRCQTRRIEQRPAMDATNVGLKCWQFVVHVTGFLHGWSSVCPYMDVTGDVPPSSASEAHTHARWRLGPRQQFEMATGCTGNDIATGNRLLFARPMTEITTLADLSTDGLTDFDVDDGPRCLRFDVVHVSGDNIFKVDATFEIHRVQCADDDTAPGNTNGVLSHRWACVDSLDTNLRTTRTYHGMLELATSNFSPHWFRHLVVPPLQEFMRREHMEFVATENGKQLQYTITDRSVAISAPPPARRWSVQHTVQSINQDAIPTSTAQIVVDLEGDEEVDKGQLIVLALYVMTAKLQGSKPGANPADNRPFFMNDITITDFTGDVNAIRLTASCRRLAGVFKDDPIGAVKGLAVDAGGINKIIQAADLPAFAAGYNPLYSADGRPGDTPVYEGPAALVGIFRCYLQSPCAAGSGINIRTNQLATDLNAVPDDEPIPSVGAIVVPTIDTEAADYYSASHQSAMYTTYQMESLFRTNKMRAAMPIALTPYGGGGVDERDACAVVEVAPPQCRRVVRIHAERVGAWPEFPNPEVMDGDATVGGAITAISQKLLSSRLLGGTQSKTCNGEDVYRARFEAVYALLRSPTPTEILKMGQNKWSTGSTTSNATLTNSTFS